MAHKLMQFIDLLVDTEELPSSILLAELSDLDQTGIDFLGENWEEIPAQKRVRLLEALGKLADDDFMLSFEALNRFAIMDPEPEVRRHAVLNLWESEDFHLVPILISVLLNDPSPDVRAVAAKALGPFVLYGESESYPRQLRDDLEKALLKTLEKETEGPIRCRCIESLGYSSHEAVDKIILDAYNSGEEDLIQSALVAMGRSADKHWAEYVFNHLHSQSPVLRYESAVAAGELELREAISELIELLDDVSPKIRRAAAWSISQIGGTSATKALSSLMENAEDEEIEILDLQDAFDHLEFINSTRNLILPDSDENQDPLS